MPRKPPDGQAWASGPGTGVVWRRTVQIYWLVSTSPTRYPGISPVRAAVHAAKSRRAWATQFVLGLLVELPHQPVTRAGLTVVMSSGPTLAGACDLGKELLQLPSCDHGFARNALSETPMTALVPSRDFVSAPSRQA